MFSPAKVNRGDIRKAGRRIRRHVAAAGAGGILTTSGTSRLRRVAGMSIRSAVRELLDSDTVAHVVTLNEDGSPHVTAAWGWGGR
jgi:hypothetical protein